jgi:UDP-GlcNAc3NAcA epimerase
MKIATIIRVRPQFIKAAAISRAIAEYNRNNSSPLIEEILIRLSMAMAMQQHIA